MPMRDLLLFNSAYLVAMALLAMSGFEPGVFSVVVAAILNSAAFGLHLDSTSPSREFSEEKKRGRQASESPAPSRPPQQRSGHRS
jgi:hypothetical protein